MNSPSFSLSLLFISLSSSLSLSMSFVKCQFTNTNIIYTQLHTYIAHTKKKRIVGFFLIYNKTNQKYDTIKLS